MKTVKNSAINTPCPFCGMTPLRGTYSLYVECDTTSCPIQHVKILDEQWLERAKITYESFTPTEDASCQTNPYLQQ